MPCGLSGHLSWVAGCNAARQYGFIAPHSRAAMLCLTAPLWVDCFAHCVFACRRAQARMALGDLLEAELDIKSGLLTSPDNTDLAALQRKLK